MSKAVLITGCDSGFGNRAAFRLVELGFRVYATVLDVEKTAKGFDANPALDSKLRDQLKLIKCDVRVREDIDSLYDYICEDLIVSQYKLHALVNNAGIAHLSLIEWGKLDTAQNVLDINALGTVRTTLRFLNLIAESEGTIVNMSSILGRLSVKGLAFYCMSKYAIASFTDGLRRHTDDQKIKVVIIEPVNYKTNMLDHIREKSMQNEWNNTSPELREVYSRNDSLERLAYVSKNFDKFTRTDIDEVVDDIIDAICSTYPVVRSKGVRSNDLILPEYIDGKTFDRIAYHYENYLNYKRLIENKFQQFLKYIRVG